MDAHHHVWDPAEAGHGWLDDPRHAPLRRSFTLEDLQDAASGGVGGRALGSGVVVQALARTDETLRLLALGDREPFVAGVVGWVDLTGDVQAQVEQLRAAPGGRLLVGVRHLVQDEPDPAWLLRDDVGRGLRALTTCGLAMDLLVGERHREAAVEAVRRAPGLRVVLDHAGKPDLRPGADAGARQSWERQVRALAELDGVVCKVSGLVTQADLVSWRPQDLRPVADVLLDAFGPRRLAFGSDWPVCLLAASWRRWADVATALTAQLSVHELDAFLGGTARGAYALATSDGGAA